MKVPKFLLLILIVLSSLSCSTAPKEPVDYVNMFAGTSSCRWMLFPGVTMPFGMVKLSPDNYDAHALDTGYEYTIESYSGFSFIHAWHVSSFINMPVTGDVKTVPGAEDDPDSGYRSRISHKRESASPGYFSVDLLDYDVKAELTATTRAGMQRYTFPQSDNAHVLFDLKIPDENQTESKKAYAKRVGNTGVEGYIEKEKGWNEYIIYFAAEFDHPFDSMNGWVDSNVQENIDNLEIVGDKDVGVYVNFKTTEGQEVLLRTGISFVSIKQARLNLETEMGGFGWDFDAVHMSTRNTWNDLLSKIKVEGGTKTDFEKFYTNLYRSYSARTIFSDVNGMFTDMCEEQKQTEDKSSPVYGCDAFWNTFWNLNQLWSMLTPDVMNSWVKSLLTIYDCGGWLPKGPGGIEYSSIMVASHEIPLIVSAYQKGIRNFDVEKAYKAIREIQTIPGRAHECGGFVGNRHLSPYMRIGYVPADIGQVSNTLEYAYDDWCFAQFAKSMDQQEDYQNFMQRAQYYKNVFDPSTKYTRPKHEGGPWQRDFEPVVKAKGKEDNFGSKDYVEGNGWQYTWFAPQDVQGLMDLLGQDEFNDRLNDGFEKARPNFTSQYVNHSNQPNMQAAFLFNYSGKPWLTQYWAREILDYYYGTGPVNGYPGDEDQGQMGSWFVMAALGLFEMDGGCAVNPFYEISSPLFEKATITLDSEYYSGKQFVISAVNNSKKNRYIQSATLNGKPLDTFWFPHSELVKGGELVLQMGPKPNEAWASDLSKRPPRDNVPELITTPYIASDCRLFTDKAEVELVCDTKGTEIYYTLNGTTPTQKSRKYTGQFDITKDTTLKIRAFKDGRASLTNTAVLTKAVMVEAVNPGKVEPGLAYTYYEGTFATMSDFEGTDPVETGVAEQVDLSIRKKDSFFAYEFKGYINIPQDGRYTFFLNSNDGSKLFIDNRTVVNSDGLHPTMELFNTIPLKKGMHPIRVQYFQNGGVLDLEFKWEGPGFKKQLVPKSVLVH